MTRITLFCFFFGLMQVLAVETYSQKTRLSLNLKNERLEDALRTIEKESEFFFLYNKDLINVEQKVNINASNQLIKEILDELLKESSIQYAVFDRQIVLSNKEVISEMTAQQKSVSGKVTDSKGSPLPGVTVVVKRTTQGTISGGDGTYMLTGIPDNATLVFSFVGMRTQEVVVGNQTSINVRLEEETIGLEEVVAIGYGTMKKSDFTGSVVSVKADDIVQSKSSSVLGGIQGKLAGVQISSQSGEPGSASNISIRGSNSVYASSAPLFVIDGIPMDLNSNEIVSANIGNRSSYDPISFLNPSDIESVEVLKDASATAIYGSRGANGVVLITTKSGKQGRMSMIYDGYAGISVASKKIDVLNQAEFIEYERDVYPNSALFYIDTNHDGNYSPPDEPNDPYAYPYHDWQDESLRVAMTQSHNLSVTSGTNKTNYLGSIGYLNEQGIVINNDQQRYTARLKVDHQQNNRLKMGINLNTSFSMLNGASHSGGGATILNGVIQNLVLSRPIEFYDPFRDEVSHYISPIAMLEDAYKSISINRTTLSSNLEYKLNKWLKINLLAGGNLSNSKGKEFYPSTTAWGIQDNGRAIISSNKSVSWFSTNQINYQRQFKNQYLSIMGAFEVNNYDNESFLVETGNFPDESTGINDISKGIVLKRLSSDRWGSKRLSWLSRINYTVLNRYLFTASYRIDGSDKFGPGNRFGYFPSFAFAWKASEEKFMKVQDFISNLKFRLSYGETGNERIPAYQYFPKMENNYYNGALGLAPASAGNENLKWETTVQYNAGIDLGLLNGRIELSADYYVKETHDMLLPAYVSSQTGFVQQWSNIGRVDNKGFELQISTKNITKKNFKWSTNFSLSSNKNKVVDLGEVDYIPVIMSGGWISNVGRVMVGEPMGTAYGYTWDGVYQIDDFTWQNNSDPTIPHGDRTYTLKGDVVSVKNINVIPGSFKFKDFDDNGIVDEDDQRIISHSSPKFFGGVTNTFTYRNFDLSVFLEGSYGNEIFNESRFRMEGFLVYYFNNTTKYMFENHWTPENPTNEYGNYSRDNLNATASVTSSYYVEDASWLRLKNVVFSYNVPQKYISRLKVSRLRVYFTGNNLKTWTKYTGYDPEIFSNNSLLPGFDRISYPRTKSYIFGINISF